MLAALAAAWLFAGGIGKAMTAVDGVGDAAWIEGEVLVRYRWPAPAPAPARIPGMAVERRRLRTLARVDQRPVERIRAVDRTTAELVTFYRDRPEVDTVSPNYLRRPLATRFLPDDPRFHAQWGLLNTGQTVNGFTGTAGADIGATRAWSVSGPAASEVVIAVIDTGVDYRHPDLADAMWRNPGETLSGGDDDGNGYIDDRFGYDFSGNTVSASAFDRPPSPDPMDNAGHGTHVAGIAAATARNAIGVAGVSSARIMALKASPDGRSIPLSDSLEAMAYAVMMKRDYGIPVAVINASFGGVGGSNRIESDLIIDAGEAGIVVCAAAGNDGADNDTRPFFPAGYQLPNLVAVAASDARDRRAAFSNYGTNTVHLAAPGANIVSTVPTWINTDAALARADGTLSWPAAGIEFSAFSDGLMAMVMDCGVGEAHQFPNRVRGKMALIERGGGLYFHQKVSHAMAAGAVAAVIYNHQPGSFDGTLVGPSDWIPALAISQDDGRLLLELMAREPLILRLSHRMLESTAYQVLSGSSMAAPHVSGAVALLAQVYPDATAEQRVARLIAAVDPVPAFADRVRSGGRLNLYRALMGQTGPAAGGHAPAATGVGVRAAATVLPDGRRQLVWNSQPGWRYRVTRAVGAPRDFVDISPVLTATPSSNVWIDSETELRPPLFYRIDPMAP